MKNARLLILMFVFIFGTLGWAAGAKLGKPVAVFGGIFGAAFGWSLARSMWRKLF